ncbi:MAG: hypothetical protein Q7J46_00040 [Pseudomonas sp.]|jgi:hypothetical protein|nr:hypothetical protein [Pseudomonas sp.]
MTPTEIITKARDRLEAATSKASMEVAQDIGLGAIGALLDLELVSVHEWRAAIDELDAMAEQIRVDLGGAQ